MRAGKAALYKRAAFSCERTDMILYSLRCSNEHEFDEWFSNSADYDARKDAGQLCCPTCGDTRVEKAIMAPRVAKAAAAPAMPRCTPQGCGGCAFAGHD